MRLGYSGYDVRRRAVHAVESGMSVTVVASAYGASRATVHRWFQRYEAEGDDGLARKPGSGRPRLLEGLGDADLARLVVHGASDFGYESDLWTVGRVRSVLEEHCHIDVSSDTVWRRLREAGLTYQKPERAYFELDERSRREWLRSEVPEIRRTVLRTRGILYFQDEANVSLTAFLGKTWAIRGRTPKVRVTGRRGGLAAMSAISRRGHLLFRLYEQRIRSAQVIEFLRQMLRHHARRHVVVVMDRAPPHTSGRTLDFVASQPRLHVFYLPTYSPDWNPDEKVWNHLKHHELKSHRAKTREELKGLAHASLRRMSRDPALVRGIFFRCCVADFFG
jgi:transposase